MIVAGTVYTILIVVTDCIILYFNVFLKTFSDSVLKKRVLCLFSFLFRVLVGQVLVLVLVSVILILVLVLVGPVLVNITDHIWVYVVLVWNIRAMRWLFFSLSLLLYAFYIVSHHLTQNSVIYC